MNKWILLLMVFAISSITFLAAQTQSKVNLETSNESFTVEVEVVGIKKLEGNLRIGVYSTSNEFASKKDIYDFRIVPVERNSLKVNIEIPVRGKFAIAMLHDINENEEMDFNWVGYPKEPYGFSNNPGIWYRVPTFDECAFEVAQDMKLKVEL